MKISREQLKEMVNESVKEKLQSRINESFTAKRNIIDIAQGLSRSFEADVCKTLNLKDPDKLDPETQRSYLAIVEKMKEQFVKAAMDATKSLINFPKNDETGE